LVLDIKDLARGLYFLHVSAPEQGTVVRSVSLQ